ncbi:polymorphic toxin-type HINT domain-containing protein [Streptomyces sp. A3M-1-3]|uniref:polymorphic toxin-type HINT domain-containing protein n=1 Tax=Streptomyces sp. A3M-1-3 TaxID=2962044 RepID=UPI0020B88633|nr:polymorphic toxin-type HINT domain-containing protein [Streptomyces sp. A3M-1-3]MCP3819225.1 polymorphic toxin-type HINT domain-containing protein [Streptomyces sp. A3M-1-3]
MSASGKVVRAIRVLCLSLLPLVFVAGLLGPVPASAVAAATDVENAASTQPTDRGRVLGLWKVGGPGVKAAAEVALSGSDADVQRFLAEVGDNAHQDDRVAAAQIASVGGQSTIEAAREALAGSPDELRVFLDFGWQAPLEQDERVRIAQVIDGGGPGVEEAGRAALKGTPQDVRKFLTEGQYAQREQDERVQLAQILSTGGPAVRAAGRLALRGSAADVREFLEVGQHVARARDQEYLTVAQLAELAREAGRQAAAETVAAKDASARAVEASKLAKAAALKAAEEASKAKDDANKAGSAAGRAASAAGQAAAAAQQAISSARAANNSARIAANAAAQAAAAAAGAAQAASRARGAAAAAATDAGNAAAARRAAVDARAAAKSADAGADAAHQASIAATAAGDAAEAAVGAGANALAAADAAMQASGYANQSDARAAEARAAAAAARRHAQEATRAANAAVTLARKAAVAAGQARDAARSAAVHANAAAKAADEAADHAGEAATAAAQSTAHARAAQEAANTASEAVEKAKAIFALAREIETAELLARTNAGIERARDLKEEDQARKTAQTKAVQHAKDRAAEAQRLAVEAAQPGADPQVVADKGRKLAVLVMKDGGPWSRAAAEAAVAGADADVVEYVRTGWKGAAQQDDRVQVGRLSTDSPLRSVSDAAEEALKGNAATVTAFLTTGQYQVAAEEYRVHIAQAISTGGPGVQEVGRATLNSGSVTKYREFLGTGQYTARTEDERVRAAQRFDEGGPEEKAAARIALEGPPEQLHAFIQSGQYTAQRKDLLGATHIAQVQRLISEAAGIAATAQQNAAEANRVAAVARKAAEEAKAYANAAAASATEAKNYAAQAAQSAKNAEASAAQAAVSAKTARQAAADANQAATNAAVSAADATVSSELAHASAATAWAEANKARASATAAGKDADAARKAGLEAFAIAAAKLKAEAEEERRKLRQDTPAERMRKCGILDCPQENDPFYCDKKPPNDPFCTSLALSKKLAPYAMAMFDLGKSIAGLDQLEECADYDLWACAELMRDVTISSKLRLLKGAYETLRALERTCVTCFPAGTKVLMGDGSTRNIEDIRQGDQVLATDPLAGDSGPRKVTHLIVTEHDKYFNALTIATRQGPEELTATYEHPFWSPSEKRWLKASDLKTGVSLLSSDGTTVSVEANRAYTQHARTYNLTVEDLHTYYVLAGSTPVLVHNAGTCGPMVLGIGEHSNGLALELNGYNFNDPKYAEVIGKVGGVPFAKWQAEVLNVLRSNGKIAVTLRGFDGDTPLEQFMNAYRAGGKPGWAATQWEMRQVGIQVQSGNLDWKNITFYDKDGKKIDNFDEPDW